MRRAYRILPALLLTLGADAPAPAARALFDGKTLTNWTPSDFYKPGDVKVAEGAVVMPVGTPMTGITSTLKDLPTVDYELTYEARRTEGRDFFAAATFPVGKSHITLVNGGWGGSVTGLSSVDGIDAGENDTRRYVKYDNGTWYRFRIRVTAKTLRCWVDDAEVVTLPYEGREISTRIETRRNRPLGFAGYLSTGELRKIAVRPLTADEIALTDKM